MATVFTDKDFWKCSSWGHAVISVTECYQRSAVSGLDGYRHLLLISSPVSSSGRSFQILNLLMILWILDFFPTMCWATFIWNCSTICKNFFLFFLEDWWTSAHLHFWDSASLRCSFYTQTCHWRSANWTDCLQHVHLAVSYSVPAFLKKMLQPSNKKKSQYFASNRKKF